MDHKPLAEITQAYRRYESSKALLWIPRTNGQ